MNKYIFTTLIVIIALGAWWILRDRDAATPAPEENAQTRTLIDTARYTCDNGKTIAAAYYENSEASAQVPDGPPIPNGSVEVSLDGASSISLNQTISASGIRYANEDESFVFWSKGDEALVIRNNSMDLEYTNCVAEEN